MLIKHKHDLFSRLKMKKKKKKKKKDALSEVIIFHFLFCLPFSSGSPPDPILTWKPLKGRLQTVQIQIRRHIMWRLVGVYSVC